MSDLSIYTRTVHSGLEPTSDESTPAVPPIVPSVGFTYPDMAATDRALGGDGFIYGRNESPTPARFEQAVADLESAEGAVAFSSGMAAIHAALLSTVPPGGVVVAAEQIYGTTHALLDWLAGAMGMRVVFADFLNADAIRAVVEREQPAAVLCEVLTNPLVRVVRLDAVVEAAKNVGAAIIVDNTFATPFLFQPLDIGASLVVHSATKFLNGHGDVLGGVVCGSGREIDAVREYRKLLGANLGAFEAWMALRGLRTLAVRMRQACLNARQIAAALVGNTKVSQVYYPGLTTDPYHNDARHLFRRNNFGAMLAFDVAGAGRDEAFAIIERLELIQPVTSLGDVHTLISHPASASHRALTPEQRVAVGIHEGTLRLSVGIEDPHDLIRDLQQALA